MSRNPIARHAWKQNKAKVIPDKRAKARVYEADRLLQYGESVVDCFCEMGHSPACQALRDANKLRELELKIGERHDT